MLTMRARPLSLGSGVADEVARRFRAKLYDAALPKRSHPEVAASKILAAMIRDYPLDLLKISFYVIDNQQRRSS